ncbi:alanine racemase [Aliihoeflea aestuarii]|jgi:D-serine dehydratase|uniref:alanine racemase n=1 Tax=Aliihoeflea aestuarii TaxID=453840 RepID=UPI0025B32C2C|nr:alanine racemase [Aliihoeflea aestuarii]
MILGEDLLIDGRIRGIPVDLTCEDATDIIGLRPSAGETAFPVLTVSRSAFVANARAMFAYARAADVDLAPHAKTPMAPELCADLVESGAWGLTVADARQARVLLESGFRRIVVANQIGGLRSAERFGRMLGHYRNAEILVFVDSITALESVAAAGREAELEVGVLIEVGGARSGARDIDTVREIAARAAATPMIELAGVSAYEGASALADPQATREAIGRLHELARQAFDLVRQMRPAGRLILSSGGSSFFDLVVDDLAGLVRADSNARLLLRSGAIYFHDHGVYKRGLAAMDHRGGFEPAGLGRAVDAFTPALRLWAEILSRPEPGLAICGMGMRDVSFDQDLPCPLSLWRDGASTDVSSTARVRKLNDQHAFIDIGEAADWQVGDIIEFGISHPCTSIDRWRSIFELDDNGAVRRILPTFFG